MLSKPVKGYVKTTPQHVKAAKLLMSHGREVKAGDIFVGKVTSQVELKLTSVERLLSSIVVEKVQKVTDNSLRVPNGIEGKVIKVKVF